MTAGVLDSIRTALGIGTDDTGPDGTDDGFDVTAAREDLGERFGTVEHGGREFPLLPEDELDLGVFPRDNAWGNKVVPNTEDGHIVGVRGWMTVSEEGQMFVGGGRRVQEGDLFAYQMESGRWAVYALVDVRHADDPDDMFFADVAGMGYVEGTFTAP